MRGLSGAVTALILVVASVVIALIVVGFAFNLFGAFASTGGVTTVGSANLYTSLAASGITLSNNNNNNPPSNALYLLVTMDNKGSNVNITSASIEGQLVPVLYTYIVSSSSGQEQGIQENGNYVPAGQNTLLIVLTPSQSLYNQLNSMSGNTVKVELQLQGQFLEIDATIVT